MNYIKRSIELTDNHHFFLFGARNTGKSTLLKHHFSHENCFWIDLLDPSLEERYTLDPNSFKQEVLAQDAKYIIIDEVQKLPKILNIIHQLIETTNKIFIMTGSSARKLKYGGANLLAGRAFVYHLFPLTCFELGPKFELNQVLSWGSLPSVLNAMQTEKEKLLFLQAYTQTYLKEEIWLEQFIRKIDPFRKFLEVSAQANGKILNIANIAKDVGVDDKTIKQYFLILKDTLMGFMLEPYHGSFRKRLHTKPKFYYFDIGVCRSLSRMLSIPIQASTSYYGEVFEHFIILECLRLASYFFPEFRFSYLRTKDDVEIDLIVERPGKPLLCIEIKSSQHIREEQMRAFSHLVKDIPHAEGVCICQEPRIKKIGEVMIFPWQEALKKFFMPG